MPKLTALQQTSGEAQYTTDIPGPADELHAAFVVSTRGNAKIVSVDPSQALVRRSSHFRDAVSYELSPNYCSKLERPKVARINLEFSY